MLLHLLLWVGSVVSIMIAANILNARNTGIFSCIIAAISATAVLEFASHYTSDVHTALLVTLGLSGITYSFILGAKYLQSIMIAILSSGIQFLILTSTAVKAMM